MHGQLIVTRILIGLYGFGFIFTTFVAIFWSNLSQFSNARFLFELSLIFVTPAFFIIDFFNDLSFFNLFPGFVRFDERFYIPIAYGIFLVGLCVIYQFMRHKNLSDDRVVDKINS